MAIVYELMGMLLGYRPKQSQPSSVGVRIDLVDVLSGSQVAVLAEAWHVYELLRYIFCFLMNWRFVWHGNYRQRAVRSFPVDWMKLAALGLIDS